MQRRAAVLLLVVLSCASPVASEDEHREQVVEKLHAKLVQVAAQARSLGRAGRIRALEPTIGETHAFDLMAQDRLGSQWSTLYAPQRATLAGLVGRLTVATYADEYRGDERMRFEGLATSDSPLRGWVTAVRIAADGTRVKFDYETRETPSGWRIVNRTENGKDHLPARRKEYAALWARGGFPALVGGLEAKLKHGAAPPAAATATQVVERLQDTLLSVMREAKQLGYAGRHKRLDPVVRETHYLPAIARLTVRRYWSEWNQAQQKAFADTFAKLSVANYASKFDGYSRENFARIEERPVGKSTVVRTVFTKSNGEHIRFDYTMRKVKGRWRILNITVDGVSDLSTKQAEYGAVLSGGGGLPALLQKLRDQIRRYESGG